VVLFRSKPFSQQRAVKIALQVALALIAAHSAGVVHRDLKPDNIMLIARGGDPDFVKVVDFGIAKLPARGQPLTALGSVFGTPEYMAPEQARGTQVDERSDLYTVGVVLYEMLTGATPFASPNLGQVIMAQLSSPPPPLPSSVDPELAEIVMRLLAKDPAERPQSAAELAAALHRILCRIAPGHPVLYTPPVMAFAGAPPQLASPVPVAAAPQAAARPQAVPPCAVPVEPYDAAAPQAAGPVPRAAGAVPRAAGAPRAGAAPPPHDPYPVAPLDSAPDLSMTSAAPKPLPSVGGIVVVVMVALLLLFAATAGLVYFVLG
jgi:eukaryotic-like serine/threonine-protein kinase